MTGLLSTSRPPMYASPPISRGHHAPGWAGCRRSAGVEGHITPERNASEPERSHARPQAAKPTGPHREGEKPKPMMHDRCTSTRGDLEEAIDEAAKVKAA